MSDQSLAVPSVFATDKLREATQKMVAELAGTDPQSVASVVAAINAADASDGRKDFFSSHDLTSLMAAHEAFLGERQAQSKMGPAGQLFVVRFNLRDLLQKREALAAQDPEKALETTDKVKQLQELATALVEKVSDLVASRQEIETNLAAFDANPKEAAAVFVGDLKKERDGLATKIKLLEGMGLGDTAKESLAEMDAQIADAEKSGPDGVRAMMAQTLAALDAAGVPKEIPVLDADPARFDPYQELASFVATRLASGSAGAAPKDIDLTALFGKAKAAALTEKPALAALVEKVAGKSQATLGKEVEEVLEKTGAYGLLYDPNKIRVTPAQDVVDRLEGIPVIRDFILPQVREMVKGWELEHRGEQAQTARATLLVKTEKKGRPEAPTPKELWNPKFEALYQATQEVAKAMGFTEEVVVVHEDAPGPNAYVYTYDTGEPRVTYMRPLVDRCWDFAKNDWVKLWLDADGKVVPEGTKGATEVPVGKMALQSVTGHELGHIRDGVMVYQTTLLVLMLMLGVDLTLPPELNANHTHGAACSCGAVQLEAARAVAEQLKAKHRVSAATLHRLLDEAVGEVAPEMGADASPEDLAQRLGLDEAALTKAKAAAQHDGEDSPQLINFMLRFMFLSQNFESTADRHAIQLQGDPQWTQLMDFMLNTHAFNTQESSKDIIAGMMGKAVAWASQKVAAGAGYRVDQVDRTGFFLSHPPGPVRILNSSEYAAKDPFFKAVQELKHLPADKKLLAMVQIAEKAIEDERIKAEALDPHDALDTNGAHSEVARHLKRAKELQEQFAPLFNYVAELVQKEGADAPAGSFIDHLIAYVEAGGSDFTADKADGGGMGGMMSLMALMGGGGGGGPEGGNAPKDDGRGQFDSLIERLLPVFAETDGESALRSQRRDRLAAALSGAHEAIAKAAESDRNERKELRNEAKKRAALRAAAA